MPKLSKTPPDNLQPGDEFWKVTEEQAKVLMDFFENLDEKRKEVQAILSTDSARVLGETDEDNPNT